MSTAFLRSLAMATSGAMRRSWHGLTRVPRSACPRSSSGVRRRGFTSHRGLHVGDCVPFYFCPRSVMLYVIYRGNHPELSYRGGQTPIVHLEADLRETVAWAGQIGRKWVFTLSNAGSGYFEERCDLANLNEIDWQAIEARDWQQHKEGKQAEFPVEHSFSWNLVRRVGVHSRPALERTANAMREADHRPKVEILRNWYYGIGGSSPWGTSINIRIGRYTKLSDGWGRGDKRA